MSSFSPSPREIFLRLAAAQDFQPPRALERSQGLEKLIPWHLEEDHAPETLQTAFAYALTRLERGSYYGHLACQILAYAACKQQLSIFQEQDLRRLRSYYEGGKTCAQTRKGEELFADLFRETAGLYLSFFQALMQTHQAAFRGPEL